MAIDTALQIVGPVSSEWHEVLSEAALRFVERLQSEIGPGREDILHARNNRQMLLNAGVRPDFLPETQAIRNGTWRVAPPPADLLRRHVEITGPTDAKMLINALNSGADVFMADFEDANAPTWANMVQGQLNLIRAVEGTLSFRSAEGKQYRLNQRTATLMVRPRGWHLKEKHVLHDGHPVAASLFDAGLFIFHNAQALLDKGSGPYLYLPKLESHLEARLWNRALDLAEDSLGLRRGTIKVTVLIETILAAFEMEEILYELRDHIVGLNAGRWDYIFSIIKKFQHDPMLVLPDRSAITMTVPFMRAYTELLVKSAHKRGAHAMGGMAAFIPSRRDAAANQVAIAKVRQDKQRECNDGFDGTWVAHPDLVPIAREVFDAAMGDRAHQKDRLRDDVQVTSADLLDFRVSGSTISVDGVGSNISVGLHYLESWLRGSGAVAINNLMEDTATAEISRAQLWQWIHNQRGVQLDNGSTITLGMFHDLLSDELQYLRTKLGPQRYAETRFDAAARLLDDLVSRDECADFLTTVAADDLDQPQGVAS